MADAERDWCDWQGDTQDLNAEYVKPFLYASMLSAHCGTGNFRMSWMVDPDVGIGSLVYDTAEAIGILDLYEHRHGPSGTIREPNLLANQAHCFANVVYVALTKLIEEGLAELHIEIGWPSVRITEWDEAAESLIGNEVVRERAARMRLRREALRKMPYPEYLKSDEWQFRRESHLVAGGNRCQLCNSNEAPLHVHHRTYANRGRERFYDLVVLCPPCHKAFHDSGRKVGR